MPGRGGSSENKSNGTGFGLGALLAVCQGLTLGGEAGRRLLLPGSGLMGAAGAGEGDGTDETNDDGGRPIGFQLLLSFDEPFMMNSE